MNPTTVFVGAVAFLWLTKTGRLSKIVYTLTNGK